MVLKVSKLIKYGDWMHSVVIATVLLRDNVANARNSFRVTSSFVLIESASGMRISLDY